MVRRLHRSRPHASSQDSCPPQSSMVSSKHRTSNKDSQRRRPRLILRAVDLRSAMESLVFSNVTPFAAKRDSRNTVKDRRVRGLSVPSECALAGPPIKKGVHANTRYHYFPLRTRSRRAVISSSSSSLLSFLLPWCTLLSWISLKPHSEPLKHLCQPKKQGPGCDIFVRNLRGCL